MEPVKGPPGVTANAHIMGDHGFQENALALRAYRQRLIAANIANADTPNYKDTGAIVFWGRVVDPRR